MAHARTQIRDAVVTALTGLATTGSNVFASRPESRPLPQTSLPCLLIYTRDESVDYVSEGAGLREQERRLSLMVQGVTSANAALDDALDQIALEVEAAMSTSGMLSGLAQNIALQATSMSFDGDGDHPVGRAELQYEILYYQTE